MDHLLKAKSEGSQQAGMSGMSVSGVSGGWAPQVTANQASFSAPHTRMTDQLSPMLPPPAHAHTGSGNPKLPDTFSEKDFLDAASYVDNKSMSLPVRPMDAQSTSESGSGPPWAIQNTLLQRYGQFMLDRLLTKQSTDGKSAASIQQTASSSNTTATVTTDAMSKHPEPTPTIPGAAISLVAERAAATSVEAQRDVYRRMLNYSMSSALTQQYYLSQYGYSYPPDRPPREEGSQSNAPVSTTANSSTSATSQMHAQLPSIDSVLLNLSTKKKGDGSETVTTIPSHVPRPSNPTTGHTYDGLQALANAAIEADPKAFSEAHGNGDRKNDTGHKSELDDVTESDESAMSPSDSSASQIMSPPRSTYTHIQDPTPHSIPSAHGPYTSAYQHKGGNVSLPGIQHFSAMSGPSPPKSTGTLMSLPPPHSTIRHSDIAALKLKEESTEEKDIADRTIQEQIVAHQLQQQVHDLTASALATGNMEALLSKLPMPGDVDPAALLAKMPLAGDVQAEFQRHMERVYEGYDPESLHSMQQHEPMELTADMIAGKATNSRRKSRGRPTSIESQRDPLGRQSSTSSLGGNTSISGASMDGDDRTYDCDLCGKQFSHNDRLRRHRKIHTTEKPYKCDICGKGFKEKCNLKHHRYIHTGEKPYKCDTCAKSFNQRSSLKTHQKVHTGEKPFRCDLCEKPFAQKYLLRQHMKKHIELNVAAAAQQ